tara:strand:- start:3525 stop:4469 length:945 start_codon:yes stop_codon:yes gene_type:complete
MADLSKRVDIVELKPGNYRRWRNDLEVALILAQCSSAAEHEVRPANIDEATWITMERNARAIVNKALRDEYWRVTPQESVVSILRKIESEYQPTSSLIAILNICKFFALHQGAAKPEDAGKEVMAAFSEMQRSISASPQLAARVNIHESVRTAVLAFAIEKTDPSAAQQIKERFERDAITFDQAVSLIAELRVTTSSSITPFITNNLSKDLCSFCQGRHQVEKCWFRDPTLASDRIREKGICKLCKKIGHNTKDCVKAGNEKKKHAFIVRHVALAASSPSPSLPSVIIDSGCTIHMFHDRRLFVSYTEGAPKHA